MFDDGKPRVYPFKIGLRYRAYCRPEETFAAPDASQWVKISMPRPNDFAVVPLPRDGDSCWTEIITLTSYGLDQGDDYTDRPHPDEQQPNLRVTSQLGDTSVISTMELFQISRCIGGKVLYQAIGATAIMAFRQRCPLIDPPDDVL